MARWRKRRSQRLTSGARQWGTQTSAHFAWLANRPTSNGALRHPMWRQCRAHARRGVELINVWLAGLLEDVHFIRGVQVAVFHYRAGVVPPPAHTRHQRYTAAHDVKRRGECGVTAGGHWSAAVTVPDEMSKVIEDHHNCPKFSGGSAKPQSRHTHALCEPINSGARVPLSTGQPRGRLNITMTLTIGPQDC